MDFVTSFIVKPIIGVAVRAAIADFLGAPMIEVDAKEKMWRRIQKCDATLYEQMRKNVHDPVEYIKWYNRVDKMILMGPEKLECGKVLEFDDITCQIHYIGGGADVCPASAEKFGMWIEIDDSCKDTIVLTVMTPGFEKCNFEYRALGETVEWLNKQIENMSHNLSNIDEIKF